MRHGRTKLWTTTVYKDRKGINTAGWFGRKPMHGQGLTRKGKRKLLGRSVGRYRT